jgi:NADP-dependent aldehyde dehydrogenase
MESRAFSATFRARRPDTGEEFGPSFDEATSADVDAAARRAEGAFDAYREASPAARAAFLRGIGEEIVALGDVLIETASAETALPAGRLRGERGRTVGQLGMFAEVIEEGSWVEARIDPARPDRTPLPRPDIRRMLIPLGPVAIFSASNFPLAFSVPGGDTASALAAGCPVVCKAHPAHPATSALVAGAIERAAAANGMPEGVFSLLQGVSHEVGLALVRHPLITAVGFTGSLRGGRALFDAAAARPAPIPVYAEMGSVNPVFLLPSAVAARAEALGEGLAGSITLGVGQFCTNPGVLVGLKDEGFDRLTRVLRERIGGAAPATMLYPGIGEGYRAAVAGVRAAGAVDVLAEAEAAGAGALGRPVLFSTSARTFLERPDLQNEVFGPASILVAADSADELESIAERLEGQLTASIHGTEEDLLRHQRLIRILERKAGRLVFNGFPTGVEVTHAMQHGGPYPATTDSRTTSVGSAAITRFARPVAYQDFPAAALPPELQDWNPRGIRRMVDGTFEF